MTTEISDQETKLRKIDKFFVRHLGSLPHHYTPADTQRLTLSFFCLSGRELLHPISPWTLEEKQAWINWIYAQQIVTREGKGGFRGGTFTGAPFDAPMNLVPMSDYDVPHLTMTYTALASLLILGDPLKRLKKTEILQEIQTLQLPSGSFPPCKDNPESDLRFLYCACCICYLLDDFSPMDVESAVAFILSSRNYDGGYGQGPGQESHGGSTYCGLASLKLLGKLDQLPWKMETITWLLNRQEHGFQGRVNKPEDTCYSFWIGASLEILGGSHWIHKEELDSFLETTASSFGGYGKEPESFPDILHSYMGLCGLSIIGASGLQKLNPELCMPERYLPKK